MNLTEEEKYRYSRHILLNEIGEKGQEKLKNARVLVVGAGGLGCPVLLYLTSAGVGNIGIVDFDKIEESNLQRQILFDTTDIGKPKSTVAKQKLETKNPFVTIKSYSYELTNKNALEVFQNYDIIVDASDNFTTRYLINDACLLSKKPLIYGAIHKFEGQISVFNYQNGPNYRCLFPNPPEEIPSCSEVGVLGVLPGIIGSLQANEVLKLILEIGSVLSGEILIYNALETSFLTINLKKTSSLSSFGINTKEVYENYDYQSFCNSKKVTEITKLEFDNLPQESIVLDVRELHELPRLENKNLLLIPMNSIPTNLAKIPKNDPVYVVCQKGIRSEYVIQFLEKEYQFNNLINLKGGVKQ